MPVTFSVALNENIECRFFESTVLVVNPLSANAMLATIDFPPALPQL